MRKVRISDMNESDKILKQTLHAIFLDWQREYDDYIRINGEIVPSDAFSKKMNQSIRRFESKQTVFSGIKRVAAVFVIIITGYLMLFLINDDVRANTIQFIRTHLLGGFTSYEIVNSNSKMITTGVHLNYVTNGFTLTENVSNRGFGHVTYTKSSKKWCEIELTYMDDTQKTNNGIDNEHSIRKTARLSDGTPCDIYICNEEGFNSFIVWKKDNTLLTLSIHDYLEGWEIDELYKIANNVELIREEK